jgi:hypothetical protein
MQNLRHVIEHEDTIEIYGRHHRIWAIGVMKGTFYFSVRQFWIFLLLERIVDPGAKYSIEIYFFAKWNFVTQLRAKLFSA